ncbi:glycosyltransferase, partial [Phenylobacterium sp.]|uniref:glycosyltransferase n=1 Tax=Phenylobacterium sp. TaxID=1871053 RepID=UPI003001053C
MALKVAIIHYWLVGMRGGEKVLEALCELFPDAHIYTHVYDRNAVSSTIAAMDVRTTFISRLPRAARRYKTYLPLMPLALEQLDLNGYDLIISSESGPAKGVVPPPNAKHICYCHSPMRYIWDHYHIYRNSAGRIARFTMPLLTHYLRIWDTTSSARVDKFIANSRHVAARIDKYYRRDADVIPPPVDVENFTSSPSTGDYYLWVGEITQYKRPDIAVEAFRKLGRRLVIIGDGEERKKLEAGAPANIEFRGRTSTEELRQTLQECRALIFPGEEDFGIVPVEAMAAGRPVIAFGSGGALDSVEPGLS